MATEEAGPQVVNESPRRDGPNDDTLKRKAYIADEDDDSHVKRQRHETENSPASTEEARRESSPRRRPSSHDTSQDRRESATQEEKKRGKRLFGGLLSTLSQKTNNPQHKRRQEIEKRQQERLQKQREEDDQKRAKKLAKIREARLAEQVGFQEKVMRHKHSKMLRMAAFLKTKAEPAIYYLPWKTTSEQEDIIDEQISAAKSTIAVEEEDFNATKGRHASRYGSRRESYSREANWRGKATLSETPENDEIVKKEDDDTVKKEHEAPKPAVHHDPHDESGDVVVDAEEDMVIY